MRNSPTDLINTWPIFPTPILNNFLQVRYPIIAHADAAYMSCLLQYKLEKES